VVLELLIQSADLRSIMPVVAAVGVTVELEVRAV
jgi:hypothetical protein